MSIPLEDAVLASLLTDLTEMGFDEELIRGVGLAFLGEKLPTPDVMVELVKRHSGDKIA